MAAIQPERVTVTRTPGPRAAAPLDLEADLANLRRLAKLLDSQFEVGGFRFGWDSIIGLIPVAGDLVTTALALYPLHLARKHNLGKTVLARMTANVLVDWAVGSVPLVGDVFDATYKANLKNLALLEKAAEKRRARLGH